MKHSVVRTVFAFLVCTSLASSLAYAQATRTWVSGVGDDANPCSRTAPCKTFAGAISKTATGGEISVLDPGGFGAVTITKSITINGDGTLAGILIGGGSGLIVNGASAVVVLRNLSLVSNGMGVIGVRVLNAAGVTMDHVTISGFQTGVSAEAGNTVMTRSTVIGNSAFGARSITGVQAVPPSLTIEDSLFTNNNVALQADGASTVRISNNGFYNNMTGFGCGGGTLASAGNNRKANNVGGVVAVCSPTVAVTVQ